MSFEKTFKFDILTKLSEYKSMSNEVTIYFDSPKSFEPTNIKPLNGIVGLYFIFSQSIEVQYPFDKSKLLYIGMSERKTNSIGSRLIGHYDGKSKNIGLSNYRKVEPLLFTYINFDNLRIMLTMVGL